MSFDDPYPHPQRPAHHGRALAERPLLWLVVLGVGLLMIAAAFSPPLNPPQCPSYATEMPDGSTCIIGANIGSGLIWLAGILVALVGGAGSLVALGTRLWQRR